MCLCLTVYAAIGSYVQHATKYWLYNLNHLYLKQINTHCYKHSNAISYAPINVFLHYSNLGTGGAIVGGLTGNLWPTLGHLTYFL